MLVNLLASDLRFSFFFLNDPPTPEIYPLPLHDALPISPPQAADDEPEMFGKYGVRVPAIIISPWIEPRSVSHTLFDHTSIIKTILSPGFRSKPVARSEEHTSELQSQSNLVCRLLLEKKK